MKNRVKLFLLIICAVFVPVLVLAQYGGMQGAGAGLSITSLGMAIVNVIWVAFTVLAVICFVVAGILFLTAFGEAEKITKARSAFIWGVVGVVVAILAFSIVSLVRNAIGA